MISELLQIENIQIIESVNDWKEGVYVSLKPLLDSGSITQHYIDTVISLTEQHGAYYMLLPEVALLHARPEDGVCHMKMSITLLKKPVLFQGKTIPTKLLIGLAATDSSSHLDALGSLSEVLSSQERMEQVYAAKTCRDMYNLFI